MVENAQDKQDNGHFAVLPRELRCGRCGAPYVPGQSFCRFCGTRLWGGTMEPPSKNLTSPSKKTPGWKIALGISAAVLLPVLFLLGLWLFISLLTGAKVPDMQEQMPYEDWTQPYPYEEPYPYEDPYTFPYPYEEDPYGEPYPYEEPYEDPYGGYYDDGYRNENMALRVELVNVQRGLESEESIPAGQEYICVTLRLTNQSDSVLDYSADRFSLLNFQGVSHMPLSDPPVEYAVALEEGQLLPGAQVEGSLIFLHPKEDWKMLLYLYDPNGELLFPIL